MDDYLIGVLSNIGIVSFIALSAWLLLLTGEISFGQQAFFAIGAYAAGSATALWGFPLAAALAFGAGVAAAAAVLVGMPTLRLQGLYFAIATLAFAEMVRLVFELMVYQVEIDGELIGPNGAEGFRGIRYVFANDISALAFLGLIYGLLAAVLIGFMLIERSRLGLAFRMVGHDADLAALNGVAVSRLKVLAAGIAGALAGLGGGLYAHLTTYVEPRIFDVMLGVHSLAYGLIGGLGSAFGPLLGVLLDIGLLELIRLFAGYRMIIFGGLVAVLLIVRPRGLLDELMVARIRRAWQKRAGPGRAQMETKSMSSCIVGLDPGGDSDHGGKFRRRGSFARQGRRGLPAGCKGAAIRMYHPAHGCPCRHALDQGRCHARCRHAVDADDAQRGAGEGDAGRGARHVPRPA